MARTDGTSRPTQGQARSSTKSGASLAGRRGGGENRLALLEHEVEPDELRDAGVPGGARRVVEASKVKQPVRQRDPDDGAARDLRLDAETEEPGRAPRVDAPFVSVAGDAEPSAEVGLRFASRDEVVASLEPRLLEDREAIELRRVLLLAPLAISNFPMC